MFKGEEKLKKLTPRMFKGEEKLKKVCPSFKG